MPRKSVVWLTDRPDMTLDVYRGRKTTIQQQQQTPVTAAKMKLVEFAISVVLDKAAHDEPPHQELHCLLSSLLPLSLIQLLNIADVNFVVCFFGAFRVRLSVSTIAKLMFHFVFCV